MKRSLLLLVVAVVVSLSLAIPASADEIVNDDPHLQVGPCTAGFPMCSGDPNYFPSTLSTIELYDEGSRSGNGSGQPLGTIALILVTPSASSDPLPTSIVSVSSGTGALGGANFLGGHWDPVTGLVSSTPMTSGNIITGYIGFQDTGDGSDNISNFNKAEASIGYPTGSYYAHIFTLTDTGLSGLNNTLSLSFNHDLPEGTIILAYSCVGKDIKDNVCTNGGTAFVPWTTAGFVDTPPVPEPGALLLLGSGLAGLGLLRWRK